MKNKLLLAMFGLFLAAAAFLPGLKVQADQKAAPCCNESAACCPSSECCK